MTNNTELVKQIKTISNRLSFYVVFCDLIEMSAIAISNQFDFQKDREDKYLALIKKYNKEEQDRFVQSFTMLYEYLKKPVMGGVWGDRLGDLYMAMDMGNDATGQVFTPYAVSQLCARITEQHDFKNYIPNGKVLTIMEPACGSGGMILAMLEYMAECGVNYTNDVLVICGDIDSKCCEMAYLQLSLVGASAIIKHQNAITGETWGTWYTPSYVINHVRFRDVLRENAIPKEKMYQSDIDLKKEAVAKTTESKTKLSKENINKLQPELF